ncbi:unnamed protein product [Lampetra fluviatilis]
MEHSDLPPGQKRAAAASTKAETSTEAETSTKAALPRRVTPAAASRSPTSAACPAAAATEHAANLPSASTGPGGYTRRCRVERHPTAKATAQPSKCPLTPLPPEEPALQGGSAELLPREPDVLDEVVVPALYPTTRDLPTD